MTSTTTKILFSAALALLFQVTVPAQSNIKVTRAVSSSTVTTKPTTTKGTTPTVKKVSTTPASTTKPVTKPATKSTTTTAKPATTTSKKTTTAKSPGTSTAKPASTPTVAPATTQKDGLYTRALGLRLGETSGITYKHFFTDVEAIEGIFGVWPNALSVTGLYEKYVPFGNVKGLNWYFGGGAHVSIGTGNLYYIYREGNRYYNYRHKYPGLAVGLDGLIGAEYKIPRAPLALSFDLKPFLEVNNGGIMYTSFDPGIGIKVTF